MPPEKMRRLFIVSTGRTGSQFLARFFHELGADAHHEPGPFWLRNLSNAYVSGSVGLERAKNTLLWARPGVDCPLYVEASCLIYGLVRPIRETFPNAGVIHVVRDPKTYVRSAMDWGVHRFGGRPLNLVPFRRLSSAHFDPWSISARVEWARAGQFERVCWNWLALNRAIRLQGEGKPGFVTVRFEDIFDRENGYPGLRAIARFADVDATEADVGRFGDLPINAARRRRFPTWNEWDASMRQHLAQMCGEEATHYQYRIDG